MMAASGRRLRSQGPAAEPNADPELGPDEFWLRQQPGATKPRDKATSLPIGSANGFVTLPVASPQLDIDTVGHVAAAATASATGATEEVQVESEQAAAAAAAASLSPARTTTLVDRTRSLPSSNHNKRVSTSTRSTRSTRSVSQSKHPTKKARRGSSKPKPKSPKQGKQRDPNPTVAAAAAAAAATADNNTMAPPVSNSQDVGSSMKTVIQNMFDVSQTVVGFVPESQNLLIDRVEQLAENLAHLTNMTNPQVSPDNPVHDMKIAPEIVDYVDDGRNPDIFSRDFVERVQRGNMVMRGKQEAFRSFAQIFAAELKKGISGIDKQVDQIMDNAGIEQLDVDTKEDDKKEKREAVAGNKGNAEHHHHLLHQENGEIK